MIDRSYDAPDSKMTLVTYSVVPYEGALPLKFGMTVKEVQAVLGKPKSEIKRPSGKTAAYWGASEICVFFSADKKLAVEFQFTPPVVLNYEGVDLFQRRGLLKWLFGFDGSAMAKKGGVIFPALGISTSGFQKGEDPADRSITIYEQGTFDKLTHLYTPFAP